jgi:hypothetical protein
MGVIEQKIKPNTLQSQLLTLHSQLSFRSGAEGQRCIVGHLNPALLVRGLVRCGHHKSSMGQALFITTIKDIKNKCSNGVSNAVITSDTAP